MPSEPHHGLIHNPGYDFMRIVNWLDKANQSEYQLVLAPYVYPAIALVSACVAIEAYVDAVGRQKDSSWGDFIKENIRFKCRLKRIYEFIDKEPELGSGIWQQVILMFKARNNVVHPEYVNEELVTDEEIPTVFEGLAQDYPCIRISQIAESAIAELSQDFELPKLRTKWHLRTYWGPPRE